jgi:hypothetical protein
MDQKLLEILKKSKLIDQRAKQFDSVDKSELENNINSRKNSGISPSISEGTSQELPTMMEQSPMSKPMPKVDVNSEAYKQRVKSSKLPPEIQKLMLESPIPQVDSPGTFSMSEEMIKEINPNYGNENQQNLSETPTNNTQVEMVKEPTQQGFDGHVIRKMIAEEIAKALPSIVEKYFDKKMIQENVKALNALRRKKRTQ